MYIIKKEMVEDLKSGRTVISIAKILGMTEVMLSYILNGHRNCTTLVAKSLICIRYNIPITDYMVEGLIDKYFEIKGE